MEVSKVFESEILSWPGVTHKWMFGCDCYMARGKMFGFWLEGGVVLIGLDKKGLDYVYAKFGAGPLVSGERVMKKWAFIPVKDKRRLTAVMPYVRESYEAAIIKAGAAPSKK